MKNIITKRLEISDDLSDEVVDLLENLLHKNPLKRLGRNGSAEIKSHPWFKNVNWQDVLDRKVKMPKPYLMKSITDLVKPIKQVKGVRILWKDQLDTWEDKLEWQNIIKLTQYNEMTVEEADEDNWISCWSYMPNK